jgi:hypothetical protein
MPVLNGVTIAISPDARDSLKRMAKLMFPEVTRPSYSDVIRKAERMVLEEHESANREMENV